MNIYYSYINTKQVYVNIHNFCITYTFYTNTNIIIKVSNLDPFKNDLDVKSISNVDFYLNDVDNNEKKIFSLVYNPAVSTSLLTRLMNTEIYILPNYSDYKYNIVKIINPHIYLDYLMFSDYTEIENALNQHLQEKIYMLEKEKVEIEKIHKLKIEKYDFEINKLIKDKVILFNEKLVLDRCIMNRL